MTFYSHGQKRNGSSIATNKAHSFRLEINENVYEYKTILRLGKKGSEPIHSTEVVVVVVLPLSTTVHYQYSISTLSVQYQYIIHYIIHYCTCQRVGDERVFGRGESSEGGFRQWHSIENERYLAGIDVGPVVRLHGAFEMEDDLIFRRYGGLAAGTAIGGRTGDASPGDVPMVGAQRDRLLEHHAVLLLHLAGVNNLLGFGE